MCTDVVKELLKIIVKFTVTVLTILVGITTVLYGDYRYNLNKYGEAPIELREIECIDIRSYKNDDLFIFEDTNGNRYKCRGLSRIVRGDKTTIKITGDNINYSYYYIIL